MLLRPIQPRDLPGAYHVCLATSNADGGNRIWVNPELLGHVYVGPYIFGPGASGAVILDALGVAGYCLGVTDTREFETWAEREWWPPLRADYPVPAKDTPIPQQEREIISLLRSPPTSPEWVTRKFPSHLHIDLLDRAQGQGWGRRLIENLCVELRDRGSSGIHLSVGEANRNAIRFYHHLGFLEVGGEGDTVFLAKQLP